MLDTNKSQIFFQISLDLFIVGFCFEILTYCIKNQILCK